MVDLERSTQLTSGPELRDVAANRSEYEPKAGLHYKATDTGAEFIGDGNRWNKIQSTGANPSFRSVSTDQQFNADNPFAARIYKDGTETVASGRTQELARGTDTQAVLQDVVDNHFNQGGAMFASRGVYELSAPLNLDSLYSFALFGESPNDGYSTEFKLADGVDDNLIEYTSAGVGGKFLTFRDIYLNGNQANQAAGSGSCLFLDNVKDVALYNVFADYGADKCLDAQSTWNFNIFGSTFEHGVNQNVQVQTGSDFKWLGGKSIFADGYGAKISASRTSIDNVFFYQNGEHGVEVAGPSELVSLENCHFLANGVSSPGIYNQLMVTGSASKVDSLHVGAGCTFDGRDYDAGQNVSNYAVTITSGQLDVDIRTTRFRNHTNANAPINDSGTRTRWNGIIGGGELGGVDLSAVSGQFEGDRAMSSGATASTGDTAYSYWTWDSANALWTDESGNTV